MPPLWPDDGDPTRGALAALDAREGLAALGLRAGIGVTTGTAFSGWAPGRGARARAHAHIDARACGLHRVPGRVRGRFAGCCRRVGFVCVGAAAIP